MLDPWIAVQPKLGSIYMATLADAIAEHNMMSPVTAESTYLHLALSAVIEPTRLADLPVSWLVKFRNQHQAELSAFRDHVAGLTTELQTVAATENPDVARAHLQSIYDKPPNGSSTSSAERCGGWASSRPRGRSR